MNFRIKKAVLPALIGLSVMLTSCGITGCASKKSYEPALKKPEGAPAVFNEVWGYVSQACIDEYSPDLPLTDICLTFGDFNCYGEIVDLPKRSLIKTDKARVHLVMICDSKSLTHFVISPQFGLTDGIIDKLVDAAEDFDGLQIDFELVPTRDYKVFYDFLEKLSKKIHAKGKMFSVCVPARFKLLTDDIYPYGAIAAISDRVFIMAYDEHWSTSKPGAIASYSWCEKLIPYATKTIPPEKLIFGLPFYARTWTDKNTSGGWYYSRVQKILKENEIKNITYEDEVPTFSYTTPVTVTGYFNDTYSLLKLMHLYEQNGVNNIGFWRIGQEVPEIWNWITVAE